MESFGQASQDKFPQILLHNVSGPKTYLDIGCHNPTDFNNSYALESAGTTGLASDYHDFSHQHKMHRKNPFLQADVTRLDWEPIIAQHFPSRVIDYISFDVDDSTEVAVKNFPFSTVRFKTMTIEHDAYRVGPRLRDSIRQTLSGFGYTLVCADVVCAGHGAFEDWWVDMNAVDAEIANKITCSNTLSSDIFFPLALMWLQNRSNSTH